MTTRPSWKMVGKSTWERADGAATITTLIYPGGRGKRKPYVVIYGRQRYFLRDVRGRIRRFRYVSSARLAFSEHEHFAKVLR